LRAWLISSANSTTVRDPQRLREALNYLEERLESPRIQDRGCQDVQFRSDTRPWPARRHPAQGPSCPSSLFQRS
jgi:hypothetical protein